MHSFYKYCLPICFPNGAFPGNTFLITVLFAMIIIHYPNSFKALREHVYLFIQHSNLYIFMKCMPLDVSFTFYIYTSLCHPGLLLVFYLCILTKVIPLDNVYTLYFLRELKGLVYFLLLLAFILHQKLYVWMFI